MHKKNHHIRFLKLFVILTIMICRIAQDSALAQVIKELDATPSVTEEGSSLLITEVNFKNNLADWAEIYYESPTATPINIKGFTFNDDSDFKKIDADYFIYSGQYTLLTFDSRLPDEPGKTYTSRKGLTGTTEQLVIYDNNHNIRDAVCWVSATPAESELSDHTRLYDKGQWTDSNIQSCIPSKDVSTNQSISRLNIQDTNNRQDWIITSTATPGTTENIEEITDIQAPASEKDDETELVAKTNSPITKISTKNTDSNPLSNKTVSKTEACPKVTTTKSSTKTTTKKYADGDLSDDIVISEIYPNPGKKEENEWIKLTNFGNRDINLGNWTLDDAEGGSKPYVIPETEVIKAGNSLLFDGKTTKLSLNNTGDEVRLFDFKGDPKNEIKYEDSPKGQSYAYMEIVGSDENPRHEWQWTKEPYISKPNPVLQEISGTIEKRVSTPEPLLVIKSYDGNIHELRYNQQTIEAPLAEITFTEGSNGKFISKDDELVGYEITSPATTQKDKDNNIITILPFALIFTIISAIAIYRHYTSSHLQKKTNDI